MLPIIKLALTKYKIWYSSNKCFAFGRFVKVLSKWHTKFRKWQSLHGVLEAGDKRVKIETGL